MDSYKTKYLKYKEKYLNLKIKLDAKKNIKKQVGGKNDIIGINYEAGKIITHILGYSNCVAYANIQIAMDAPYHGRVASEEVRKEGRSETFFPGYDENYLIDQLSQIFGVIKKEYGEKKIIIQIARGRAAKPMYTEVLEPIIKKLGVRDVEFVNGYRTENYYQPKTKDEEFAFVNVGMFAVLQGVERVRVAEICNPNETIIITAKDAEGNLETDYKITTFNDSKNILNSLPFQKITLAGISDTMSFVVPKEYPKEKIDVLIKEINKIS